LRGNIHVSAANGEMRLAADWVGKNGRARKLRDAEVSAARQKVGAVVCVKACGHEGGLASGRQQRLAFRASDHQALFQKVDHRTQLPRQQGPALRHGHERVDRLLRTSTVKRRVHSLFRQGCLLYDLIPNMPEAHLRPLIERYAELIHQNATFADALGDHIK
jgi:hypothetical protein